MSTLENNPLLAANGLPPFDRIKPEHVVPAVKSLLAEAEKSLAQLERDCGPSWEGLLKPLEELDHPFEYGWGPVTHLMGVKNSTELREAYEEVLPEMVAFGLRARQSEPIYRTLKQIRESDQWDSYSESKRRIIEHKLLAAELAGIGLAGNERARFNEIAKELSQLSTDFSNHVLDATKAYALVLTDAADAEGFPESLRQLTAHSYNEHKTDDDPQATPETGPWRITLDYPVYIPFMEHCRKPALREQVYRAFVTRAASGEWDNSPLIPRILKLRQEKAKLLGYANYAELSLAQKMAPSVQAVEEMFETLRSASWDAGVTDLEDLRTFARQQGESDDLQHWDIPFWAERLSEDRFDFTDEELRPYFPLENVLNGMFSLVQKLFGITVRAADGEAPVWQKDVRFFRVLDENDRPIAMFYLDPYSRPEDKRGGAWMDECLGRRYVSGKLQLPVAYLVCNSTPPVGQVPSLMTFREVETLFHEFGHGLQHMLTTVDEADASGISGVEWDAVELASQFMENWCYHQPTLLGLSVHYKTGETLPLELFEKIKQARNYRAGTQMLRQLLFGMTDMTLHVDYNPDGDQTVFDVQREIAKKTSVLPLLPENRSLCSFQHIFSGGYAAGYYSYKWSEVLSADAFSMFEEAGLDNEEKVAEIGRRYRDTILALGGSRHPLDVFIDFRGREPDPSALLKQCDLLPK